MDLRTQRRIDKYAGGAAIALLRPATMVLGALLRRDHELDVRGEVVWVKMLGGGSLLLAMPMLLGFKRAYPDARMVLVTTPAVKPFAELMGVFDEYRIIDQRGAARCAASAARAWIKTLRADCIVDLEVYSRLTTVFSTATLARNRVSFWLEDIFWRRGLSSHLVYFNRSSASYHFYDRVADLFGFRIASREECRAVLLRESGLEVEPVPLPHQGSIGFACSDLGQERMLTPDQWVRVVEANLSPELGTLTLLGGPGDRARGDAIIAAVAPRFPGVTFHNACGEMNLRQSVASLFSSREFWGIDSSLLHLARIAGLRCVSYWGPTDPSTRLRANWGVDDRVFYRKIACSPCVHATEEPPCRGDNRCIQGLFANESQTVAGWTPIESPPHRGPRHE